MNGTIFTGSLMRVALLSSSAMLAAVPARAEEPAPRAGLEDIVVTARKRTENIQDTPVSVAAFSGEALAQRQAGSIADVARLTPNVQFDTVTPIGGASNAASVYIRGIGQNEYTLTIDPGVGLYVDGVYVSRSVGSVLDTLDLAQVEVLRGPQGTLFGKNTIGGAISLTSRKPGDRLAGSIEGTTGSYDRFDLRGTLDVPVTDRLRIGLAASRQRRDGYVKSLYDGSEYGNKNAVSGRLVAVWDATDALHFTLAADATRIREQTAGLVLLAVNANALFPTINNLAVHGATCGSAAGASPTCYNGQWLTGSKYTNYNGGPRGSDIDVRGVSLTGEWTMGGASLKSITAYRHVKSAFDRDADHSPLVITDTITRITQEQFSQEFQLSGTGFDKRLKWLAGAFYMKEKGNDVNFAYLPGASFQSGGRVDNDSYALFGQASYDITRRLSLTVGARQSWDSKRFLPDQKMLTLDPAIAPLYPRNFVTDPAGAILKAGDLLLPHVEQTASFQQFTPSVSVDYRFSPSAFVYVSYSKGFKSGGFTQRVFPPDQAAPPFKPEKAEAYEAGLKLELFGRRLRWNSAVFRTNYSDIQVTIIQPGAFAPQFQNAGDARITGFESEFEAVPIERLHLSGGVGYTDAKYRRVDPRAAGVTLASKLVNTPKWTLNAGIGLDIVDSAAGKLTVRGDWSYKSTMFRDAQNSPICRTPGYSVFNGSIAFAAAAGWTLSAGATNIGDKAYLISCLRQNAGGYVEGTYSRPREWFLKLAYRF